jgi:hypothetical protein
VERKKKKLKEGEENDEQEIKERYKRRLKGRTTSNASFLILPKASSIHGPQF